MTNRTPLRAHTSIVFAMTLTGCGAGGIRDEAPAGVPDAHRGPPENVATATSRDPASGAIGGPGTILTVSIAPAANEQYRSADFRMYLPGEVRTVRGVIVHQHGCGRNGITMADDVHWQALANKWGMALLGTLFRDRGECSQWSNPMNGTERAFLEALARFAQQSGHPELATAPWVLWGHSGGASWVVSMMAKHPARVVATVPKSLCGRGTAPSTALAVPTLLVTGPNDIGSCFDASKAAAAAGRAAGATWGVAIDPRGSHAAGRQRYLVIPYLDAVIARRLPEDATAAGPVTLRPITASSGWLGNGVTFEIAAEPAFAGDKTQAAWLPDEATAKRWQEFSKTGNVTDNTAPTMPPSMIAARVEGATVTLTWAAIADLEGGLRSFTIYRDGTKVGSYAGAVNNNYNRGDYQAPNFGDEPEPPLPAATFKDDAKQPGKYSYQVTSINWSGLESPKSATVEVVVR